MFADPVGGPAAVVESVPGLLKQVRHGPSPNLSFGGDIAGSSENIAVMLDVLRTVHTDSGFTVDGFLGKLQVLLGTPPAPQGYISRFYNTWYCPTVEREGFNFSLRQLLPTADARQSTAMWDRPATLAEITVNFTDFTVRSNS